MDTVAESGLKWVHFPLKYNTMVWPLCIFDLHHLSWGGGGVEFTPLHVFLSLFPQISTDQLQIFCL